MQYAVSTLHGRDQSPGVPWGADGDGAIFYRAWMCSRVLGWILYTRRYVVLTPPLYATAGLYTYDDLSTYTTPMQYKTKRAHYDDDPATPAN